MLRERLIVPIWSGMHAGSSPVAQKKTGYGRVVLHLFWEQETQVQFLIAGNKNAHIAELVEATA